MAYRNDVDALEARLVAIQGELDDATRQRDVAAHLLEEARARAATEGLAADWAAGGPQRRRRRRVRILIATLAFTLVGGLVTYRVTRDRGAPDLDEVMARLTTFTDQMCACHDKGCATQVMDGLTAWSTEMARTQSPKPVDLDDATRQRMSQLGERLGQCITKSMTPPESDPEVIHTDPLPPEPRSGLVHVEEELSTGLPTKPHRR